MATTTAPAGATVPAVVHDVDVARALPAIAATRDGRRVREAWVLTRLHGEPIGLARLPLPASGLTPAALAHLLAGEFGPEIRRRVGDVEAVAPDGLRAPRAPAFLVRRDEVLADAPPITAVVCTRDRPDGLRRVLASLAAQHYPRARILVVDNAPTSDAGRRVVEEFSDVEYLVERRPGLSNARNTAVAARPGEILAWTDDDVVADPYWLAEIARALADHPGADAVSGVIVPGELDNDAQLWFEEFGGHSKGRGFTPAVFSPATATVQSPLYPLPPFGTGANMAFRPGVIESIGGFDPALGAGTPAMGSEDTAAFMTLLHAGGTMIYQPTALVWHFHRPDLRGLDRQLVGYGTGLTAAYTSMIIKHPSVLPGLVRLVPAAVRDLFGPSSQRTAGLGDRFPTALLGRNRQGMLRGPVAYLRGRRRHRRADSLQPGRRRR